MSKFEDRLWRQIVREHGADLSQMHRPADKHAWRSRPRMLAGTTVGLAGLGTAVALVLGAASSSPAFAVTRNSDGTVSVTIKQLSGIAGANQRLAALGIRARAVAVGVGCDSNWTVSKQTVAVPSIKRNTSPERQALVTARAVAGAKIDPGKIPAGRTVVIATWRAGRQVHLYASRAVAGPPPACLAPAAAAKRATAAAANAACRIQVLPGGGNSGKGNSGNSGAAGASANTPKFQTVKRPNLKELKALVAKARARAAKANAANSGSSGSTGSSGNSGNSGSGAGGPGASHPHGYAVVSPDAIDCTAYPLPTTGNSGNSGNSGNAGNSGNSGNSGSAASNAKAGSRSKH